MANPTKTRPAATKPKPPTTAQPPTADRSLAHAYSTTYNDPRRPWRWRIRRRGAGARWGGDDAEHPADQYVEVARGIRTSTMAMP